MAQAGEFIVLDVDELEEAGEEEYLIVLDEEAGVLEIALPIALADQMRRQRGQFPGFRGRGKPQVVKVPRRGVSKDSGLARQVQANTRSIAALRDAIERMRTGGTLTADLSTPGGSKGYRPLAGATLAVAAPGAVGMAPFGPLNIQPQVYIRVTSLIVEFWEDASAVAVAGAEILCPTPFLVNALQIASDNMIKSVAGAVPGAAFQVRGANYGYPLGVEREVDMPPSTILTLAGTFSPRAPAGASASDVTGAVMGTGIVKS